MHRTGDPQVVLRPGGLRATYPPYEALPYDVLAPLVAEAKTHTRLRNLTGLLDVVTRAAEYHVTPDYWAVGGVFQSSYQVDNLYALAHDVTGDMKNGDAPAVACDIGLDAGHSAALWLYAGFAPVYSFDLLALPHSATAVELLNNAFPGALVTYRGNTWDTLPEFIESAKDECDLTMVDGSHTGKFPSNDVNSAISMGRSFGLIIADDVTYGWPWVHAAWKWAVDNGMLAKDDCREDRLRFLNRTVRKRWCWGYVNR